MQYGYYGYSIEFGLTSQHMQSFCPVSLGGLGGLGGLSSLRSRLRALDLCTTSIQKCISGCTLVQCVCVRVCVRVGGDGAKWHAWYTQLHEQQLKQ